MKRYFVVFAFNQNEKMFLSNLIIDFRKKITTSKDIKEIENNIERIKKYKAVSLINWKKVK